MADAKDLEVLVFGGAGAILMALDFPISPVLLGYVLGPLIEENFRRALEISGGDFLTFIEGSISATVSAITLLLVLAQLFFWVRSLRRSVSVGQAG
jgi:TctA family transporter